MGEAGQGCIIVKNLDASIDNQALYDTFSLFGNILSCKVECGIDGKSTGSGIVHFEEKDSAKQAIDSVNDMKIGENTVTVEQYMGDPSDEDDQQAARVAAATKQMMKPPAELPFPDGKGPPSCIDKRPNDMTGEERTIVNNYYHQVLGYRYDSDRFRWPGGVIVIGGTS